MKQAITLPPSPNGRIPAARHPFYHKVDLQIRFNDIDMLGHLNNSVYLQFFDLGKIRYFTEVCPEAVDLDRINMVIVNINCDFFAPTFLTERIAVLTTVDTVGTKSLTLDQRIVDTDTGEIKSMCRTVMAGIDLSTGQSAPIEQKWIDALSAYEERDVKKPV